MSRRSCRQNCCDTDTCSLDRVLVTVRHSGSSVAEQRVNELADSTT